MPHDEARREWIATGHRQLPGAEPMSMKPLAAALLLSSVVTFAAAADLPARKGAPVAPPVLSACSEFLI